MTFGQDSKNSQASLQYRHIQSPHLYSSNIAGIQVNQWFKISLLWYCSSICILHLAEMTLFIGVSVYYSNIWHNILLQYPVQYLQRRMAQLFLLTRDHNCFPCRLLVIAFFSVTCGSFWFSTNNLCQLTLVSPGHTIKSGKDSLSSYMHSNHLQHLSCQSVAYLFMACNSLSKCDFQSVLCRTQ